MPKIRLLIADDHKIMLEGIVSLLQSEGSFEVAATAANGYEVMELVNKNEYDVCLLDINMPRLDGMEAAKLLKATHEVEKRLADRWRRGDKCFRPIEIFCRIFL